MQLRAENIQKIYGKRTVVKDVSFHVEQGEIVGLLGPNGAGKTTSFYMVTGLIQPNHGKVLLATLYKYKTLCIKKTHQLATWGSLA
jgi:lipopolysaccharide export system ATP-binding protein